MPRSRRIALVGHPHVIVAKGNASGTLFFDDSDFNAYLGAVREFVREEHFALYAFCLMRGEIRLVVEPRRLPLAQTIQRLHGSHARRINKRQERTGHVFEGRYKSIVIDRAQIASAVRAVHLWPVRNERVRRTELYPWSSHRAYVAQGDEWTDLVDAWTVLEEFGATLPLAQRAFARFVEEVATDRDGYGVSEVVPGIAGSRRHAESVLAEAGVEWKGRRRPALKTLARRVTLVMNVSLDDMLSASRTQDLVLARRLLATSAVRMAGRTVTEVAHFLKRDKAQVSRLVQQGMNRMRNDEAFRLLIESIRGRAPRHSPTKE